MKVSICIPQYNRINHLIKALKMIELQDYPDIEVVVSDDRSTDNTVEEVKKLQSDYKYPLRLSVNEVNQGYDRNFRKCIELATGQYAFVLGNDDSLFMPDAISFLVGFLKQNNLPDIGYCNYVEEQNTEFVYERANSTGVHGTGVEVAMNHYNGFSFVGGLIYKKSTFDEYNTDKHDQSVYAQMYLGLLMICKSATLFTIKEPLVLKDLLDESGKTGYSFYKDGLPKKWKDFRPMNAGLFSVAKVLISAVEDATGQYNEGLAYRIIKRIYSVTYPYWLMQYKKYSGLVAAGGLVVGLKPKQNPMIRQLRPALRTKLRAWYMATTFAGLFCPVWLFDKLEPTLIARVRSKNS